MKSPRKLILRHLNGYISTNLHSKQQIDQSKSQSALNGFVSKYHNLHSFLSSESIYLKLRKGLKSSFSVLSTWITMVVCWCLSCYYLHESEKGRGLCPSRQNELCDITCSPRALSQNEYPPMKCGLCSWTSIRSWTEVAIPLIRIFV